MPELKSGSFGRYSTECRCAAQSALPARIPEPSLPPRQQRFDPLPHTMRQHDAIRSARYSNDTAAGPTVGYPMAARAASRNVNRLPSR